MHDDHFVLDVSLAEVDAAWDELCKANPSYFDGDIVHVIGVNRTGCGGATLQTVKSSYRFHAVGGLGIQPLGVKGICMLNDLYLCGFRGSSMGAYPLQWEFAPAGMVEPGQLPADVIERELEEETGLSLSKPATAVAIFFDDKTNTWEIVYQLNVTGTPQVDGIEYEKLEWFDIKDLPTPMSLASIEMKSLL